MHLIFRNLLHFYRHLPLLRNLNIVDMQVIMIINILIIDNEANINKKRSRIECQIYSFLLFAFLYL